MYGYCSFPVIVPNGNNLGFDPVPALAFQMDAVLKLEGQRRVENGLFTSGKFDYDRFANPGRSIPQQRQQRWQTDRAHVRKKAGKLLRTAQLPFCNRCDQRAVHAIHQSSRTHTEQRRNMHEENQKDYDLEVVEGFQNKWLRNFRQYFAGSESQHDTIGVSQVVAARASGETAASFDEQD